MTNDIKQIVMCAEDWCLRFFGSWLKPAGTMKTHATKKPMRQMELYGVYAHPNHKISSLVWNDVTYDGADPYIKVRKNSGYVRNERDNINRSNPGAWTEDGYTYTNDGNRQYTDVLLFPNKPRMKMKDRTIHPTQKPQGMFEVFVKWVTNRGDIVLDPFLGSGTTILSCTSTQRTCYGVEKDPLYMGLVLDRCEKNGMRVEKLN